MEMWRIKRKRLLLLQVFMAYSVQICLSQVQWVGAPKLQAVSPAHFALQWTAADLNGVPDSFIIEYRYDAIDTNVASVDLPGTATSYVVPAETPIDFNFFQVSVSAVSGGVPVAAENFDQIGDGDPRLPPQPSGTVTQPDADTYRISNIAGAGPTENYVVWAWETNADPANTAYLRVELPPGTATYDVTGLAPDASLYTIALYTERDGLQSDPAVLVFQQDDIHVNDCLPYPCLNGGFCNDGLNTFTCTCLQGFTGTRCEINTNDCVPNPCLNGGFCVDGVNTFTCQCLNGFTGDRCQTNTNDCQPNPCQNGGVCMDGTNTYTCVCPTGFSGTHCEMAVNNCDPVNPCLNNGQCITQVGGYTCVCQGGFTGTHCEINVNDCAVNQCLNNGACIDGVNSYTCLCPPGFDGNICQNNIDDCNPNPCLNGGICFDGIQTHTCTCRNGFIGLNCESTVDNCAQILCFNGGVCVNLPTGFRCDCAAGFTGDNCETGDTIPWLAIIIAVAVIGALLIVSIACLPTRHFRKKGVIQFMKYLVMLRHNPTRAFTLEFKNEV